MLQSVHYSESSRLVVFWLMQIFLSEQNVFYLEMNRITLVNVLRNV